MLTTLCLAACLWMSPPASVEFSFDKGTEDWTASPLDPGSAVSQTATAPDGHVGVLKITGKTPPSIGASYKPWQDWRQYEWLSFDLYIPKDAPNDLSVYVYLKDKQYWWYQTPVLSDPLTGERRYADWRGKWLSVRLDVSADSFIWQPGGHAKAWNRALFYPRELGIRAFANGAWNGQMLVDNLCLSGNQPPLGRIDPNYKGYSKHGLQVYPSAESVPVDGKLELTFHVDHEYENPFDPDVVDVTGHFLAPSGKEVVIPGFFYQQFERMKDPDGNEKMAAVGPPCWKVRFSPTEQGKWRYYVQVKDALGELHSDEQICTAGAAGEGVARVRVSQKDGRFFETSDGKFFYPLGINMRDGGDQAAAERGTYDFDDYFPEFAAHNIRFCRTWMCAWWAGIEWTDRYDSRFDGAGRYAMYNAWRLDHTVDLADKYQIYLEITLNSHGQIRRDKFDAEWQYNPYSTKNGGMVASPAMFFTDEDVKRLFRQRYRYIMARWGYSAHVMSWDLWNEVDLVEGYNPEEVAAWHKEMADYLRSIDPWQHLITSHICLYWQAGKELFDLPEIQYVQADHYWNRENHKGLDMSYRIRREENKPYVAIEYGPTTAELPVTPEVWQREFRVGMWASNCMPSAMPAVFWYNQTWREDKLWEYQKGMEAYNAGEDRRGAGWEQAQVGSSLPRQLALEAMSGKQGARFYAYSWENMLYPKAEQVPQAMWLRGAVLVISGVPDGKYAVEIWDPVAGKVLGTSETTAQAGKAAVTLPDFAQEIAGKLKPM